MDTQTHNHLPQNNGHSVTKFKRSNVEMKCTCHGKSIV